MSKILNDSDKWVTVLSKKLAMWWPWVSLPMDCLCIFFYFSFPLLIGFIALFCWLVLRSRLPRARIHLYHLKGMETKSSCSTNNNCYVIQGTYVIMLMQRGDIEVQGA